MHVDRRGTTDIAGSNHAGTVLVETVDDIAVVTLDNPTKRNAIDIEMRDLLMAAFDRSTDSTSRGGSTGSACTRPTTPSAPSPGAPSR